LIRSYYSDGFLTMNFQIKRVYGDLIITRMTINGENERKIRKNLIILLKVQLLFDWSRDFPYITLVYLRDHLLKRNIFETLFVIYFHFQ